jgi:hypothetical protein
MDRMHHNFAYTRLLTRVLRFDASELRVLHDACGKRVGSSSKRSIDTFPLAGLIF